MRQREKVIPLAFGNVLEIGIGSGLNLPYYDISKVKHLTGIDPCIENWKLNANDIQKLGIKVEFIQAAAGDIPFDDNQFDSAVITYALCSIDDPFISLDEIRRVLKPSGKFIFCEHGLAPDEKVRKWQKTINPVWRALSGGCNLNRDVPGMLDKGGFKIMNMDKMYIPGWRIASFNYWGIAQMK